MPTETNDEYRHRIFQAVMDAIVEASKVEGERSPDGREVVMIRAKEVCDALTMISAGYIAVSDVAKTQDGLAKVAAKYVLDLSQAVLAYQGSGMVMEGVEVINAPAKADA